MHKALEIVQLAGELELDCEADESDSDIEAEGEESFKQANVAQGEVVLLGKSKCRQKIRKETPIARVLHKRRRLPLRAMRCKRVAPS